MIATHPRRVFQQRAADFVERLVEPAEVIAAGAQRAARVVTHQRVGATQRSPRRLRELMRNQRCQRRCERKHHQYPDARAHDAPQSERQREAHGHATQAHQRQPGEEQPARRQQRLARGQRHHAGLGARFASTAQTQPRVVGARKVERARQRRAGGRAGIELHHRRSERHRCPRRLAGRPSARRHTLHSAAIRCRTPARKGGG